MKRLLLCFVTGAAFLIASCDKSSGPTDPAPVDKPDDKEEIVASVKVMAYNIHHCNPPSKPNIIDVAAIVDVIRAEKPDLLALQEVDVDTERSGAVNQAQEIANQLQMRYFFAKAIDYRGGEYGVAILSKYPLSETTAHQLPTKAGSGGEPRVLATAKVELPDGRFIRFGSTHLDAQSDPTNRQLQIEKISDIASKETLPFIIAGDFNATPGSVEINALDAIFKRSCKVCAPTIPATNPTKAIDFIAYAHPATKLSTISHKVVNEPYASDHRPVVAEIGMQ
ncbi:endonuclease/exonuclease/phosphatase family protein [uncultured Pontibacter sp.]|uniref:endonuclease/exonuclease/phosphatase family protein n=1 Tax=uncultured Pontibacter sp. TaxID=453356 RepID=UPI00260BA64E|nr:endonuclease/exonuclease/phosphatase family protein [uncultured Pontibacter sp.]